MDWRHILFGVLLLAVGYWAGGKWPGMLGRVPVVGSALSS